MDTKCEDASPLTTRCVPGVVFTSAQAAPTPQAESEVAGSAPVADPPPHCVCPGSVRGAMFAPPAAGVLVVSDRPAMSRRCSCRSTRLPNTRASAARLVAREADCGHVSPTLLGAAHSQAHISRRSGCAPADHLLRREHRGSARSLPWNERSAFRCASRSQRASILGEWCVAPDRLRRDRKERAVAQNRRRKIIGAPHLENAAPALTRVLHFSMLS
jgi:hypothetical protein